MNTPNLLFSESSENKSRWLVAVFFAVYLFLGLFIYKDYGIYFDDHWGRENGVINGLYIAEQVAPSVLEGKNICPECPPLGEYVDGDHGPIFELVPTFLEWVFSVKDLQKIFQLRHLCTFLLFYISTIFFYLLLQERFRKPLLSLMGVLMLVASPRIFAESFYNSKDLPFLSVSIISTYTLVLFLKNQNYKTAFWHALMCALAIDLRLLGLIFPVFTIGFSILNLKLFRKDGAPITKTITLLAFYGVLLFGFIILFWPYLWVKPFVRFPQVLERSSAFPWMPRLLYMGKAIFATELPWHYIPVWIFITTPLWYIFLFFSGLVFILRQIIRPRPWLYRDAAQRQDWIMAGLFLTPVLAAIFLKLVLYDGWRHLYFIYPALIYVALLGFYWLLSVSENLQNLRFRKFAGYSLLLLWAAFTGRIAYWMISNHPHQNVYFSIYKSDSVRQKFELDYWGLAYKQGLEFILQHSNKPEIQVFAANLPGKMNQFSLPPEQRKRLVYVDHISKADYFLTEYRWHPSDYPLAKEKEVYQIKVDDIKIFSVFEVNKATKNLKTHLY